MAESVLSTLKDKFLKSDLELDKQHPSGYVPTAKVLAKRMRGLQAVEIEEIGTKVLGKRNFRSDMESGGVWFTHHSLPRGSMEREEALNDVATALWAAGYKVQIRNDEYTALFNVKPIKEAEKVHKAYLGLLADKGSKGAALALNRPISVAEKRPLPKGSKPAHLQEDGDVEYEVAGLASPLRVSSKKDLVLKLKALGFKPNGLYSNVRTRAELQGQPKFQGLAGPMWGGPGKIRYETVELYNALSAATDTGSAGKDKSRRADLEQILAEAAALRDAFPPKAFPEVASACKAVDALVDLSKSLVEAQVKLKSAPSKTEEASMAQSNIDELRARIDSMIIPLKATISTMTALVDTSAALEEKFAQAQRHADDLASRLKSEKARLAALAKAVESTAKMA